MSLRRSCNDGPCPKKEVCWKPEYTVEKECVTIPEYVPVEVEHNIHKKLWSQDIEMRQCEEKYLTVSWKPTYEWKTHTVERPCIIWKSRDVVIPVKSYTHEKVNRQYEQQFSGCKWVEEEVILPEEKCETYEVPCEEKERRPRCEVLPHEEYQTIKFEKEDIPEYLEPAPVCRRRSRCNY